MDIVKQARDNRDSTVGQNKKKRKYLHCNPHYCVRFAMLAVVEFSIKKQQKLAKPPAGSSYVHTSIEKLARFGYKIAELLLRKHHRQFLFCQLSRFHFCFCFCCFCCLKKQLIDWVVPLFTFSTFLIWFWQAEIFSARKNMDMDMGLHSEDLMEHTSFSISSRASRMPDQHTHRY